MHIIFISATCARADYEDICKKRKYPLLDSSQKFFEMFLKGLATLPDVTVDSITLRPISQGTYPDRYIKADETNWEGIRFHYVPVWNLVGIKTVLGTLSIQRKLRSLIRKYRGQDVRIMCDPLLLEGLIPTIKLGRRFRIETVGFLTDMPDFADECDRHNDIKKKLYQAYNKRIQSGLAKLDKHIVLTEGMSCVAQGKPWLLLDCIVDESMLMGLSPAEDGDDLPHVLYAGKIHEEFGLDVLVQTIPMVKTPCVFDIYGDGNYREALQSLADRYDHVKMHGIVPLREVMQAELGAAILINPRTSAGEFTKYSFPSKTAEYMLAGSPVVMFKLPGIHEEYGEYIDFVRQETPQAFAEKIEEILALSHEQRQQKGIRAKEFIVQNKNNVVQAQRVLDFLIKDC